MHSHLLAAFAVLSISVSASIYPTQPIQSTVWDASAQQTIQWSLNAGGPDPSLLGNTHIALYTGGWYQQTFLSDLTGSRYVTATENQTVVRFDTSVGPSGHFYFLVFQCDALDFPIFSGRFTLENMTGTFNSTVLAQLATLGSNSTDSGSSQSSSNQTAFATATILPSQAISVNSTSGSSSSAAPTGQQLDKSSASIQHASSILAGLAALLYIL